MTGEEDIVAWKRAACQYSRRRDRTEVARGERINQATRAVCIPENKMTRTTETSVNQARYGWNGLL